MITRNRPRLAFCKSSPKIVAPMLGFAIAIGAALYCAPAYAAPSNHTRSNQDRQPTDSMRLVNKAVNSHVDGTRALQTAQRIDRDWWWRWPGTPHYEATIDHLAQSLEAAGYVLEENATDADQLIYRVEEYPLRSPAWEPISASLIIDGTDAPLLSLATNRNMVVIGSAPTAPGGEVAELVDAGRGTRAEIEKLDVKGKIVLARTSASAIHRNALRAGAIGVLSYRIPNYNRAQKHVDSIPFTSIGRRDGSPSAGFAINLSHRALKELETALGAGPVRLRVNVQVKTHEGVERAVVAEAHGSGARAEQRIVYSAHVQEPGANDNASGVAVQLEMARALASLVRKDGRTERTITMLWGLEISSTARYLRQDPDRAEGVMFGVSLDMVGADPAKTGGVFLVEKMPDPSAVWTRGDDEHTEWGGRPLRVDDMTPHFFNDFVIQRCRDQAAHTGWQFDANPYEGGSDHVPFLNAEVPAVLLWHFTDEYYHTDGDRASNLSADVMANAACVALSTGLILAGADADTASMIVDQTLTAARKRLQREFELSRHAIENGNDADEQKRIISTWAQWYRDALATISIVEPGGASDQTQRNIERAQKQIRALADQLLAALE